MRFRKMPRIDASQVVGGTLSRDVLPEIRTQDVIGSGMNWAVSEGTSTEYTPNRQRLDQWIADRPWISQFTGIDTSGGA